MTIGPTMVVRKKHNRGNNGVQLMDYRAKERVVFEELHMKINPLSLLTI